MASTFQNAKVQSTFEQTVYIYIVVNRSLNLNNKQHNNKNTKHHHGYHNHDNKKNHNNPKCVEIKNLGLCAHECIFDHDNDQ